MGELNLLQLFGQIANGDAGAFKEVFNEWYPRVYNTAYGYTKSPELSGDIAQQVFLKLWERRAILRQVKDPGSWLVTTTKYQAFHTLKKEAARDSFLEKILHNLPESADTPETALINSQQAQIIQQALDGLTARQREAYWLHRHEGWTYKQIAEKTGISADTVREHVYKALKAVQTTLKARRDEFISGIIIFLSNFW